MEEKAFGILPNAFFMRILLLLLLVSGTAAIGWFARTEMTAPSSGRTLSNPTHSTGTKLSPALRSRAADARTFAVKNGMNPDLFFLIDMSLFSGSNRFVVYRSD